MNRLIAAAFLASTLMGAGLASAMPLAPLTPARGADVIEVAGGCGPGWHRGPYGGCLRNYANPAAPDAIRGRLTGRVKKQRDGALGSDSIRTEGCLLFGHVTHCKRGGPKGPPFFASTAHRR